MRPFEIEIVTDREAVRAGRRIPVYGNGGSISSLPMGIALQPWMSAYFQETEEWIPSHGRLVPNQSRGSIPNRLTTLAKKVAEGSIRGTGKPQWSCLGDPPPLNSTTRLYLAEEAAHAVSPWSLLGFMESDEPPQDVRHANWAAGAYHEHLRHTKFVNENRGFLIDRTRVADVALVYCLACSFWRVMGDVTTGSSDAHLEVLMATARMLEHAGVLYEVVVLGFDGLWQNRGAMGRLANSNASRPYQSVILPAVDALSDDDAEMLRRYVRRGGTLVLNPTAAAGDVPVIGSKTERLVRRQVPALAALDDDPGGGKVIRLPSSVYRDYLLTGNATSEAALVALLRPQHPSMQFEPSLPPHVWVNVHRHGGGPMISCWFVNYHVDVASDEIVPSLGPFTAFVSIEGCELGGESLVAQLVQPSDPSSRIKLRLRHLNSTFVAVEIPAIRDYAVVVIGTASEIQARRLAGDLRKSLSRLIIANQTRILAANDPARAERTELALQADRQLQGIQGHDAPRLPVAGPELLDELNATRARIESHLGRTVAIVQRNLATSREQTTSLCSRVDSCTAAFSFGPATGDSLPRGWQRVDNTTAHTASSGFGFTSPTDQLFPLATGEPDWLHRSALWSSEPARFCVDLPAGSYEVTVISGGNDLGSLGAALAGGAWGGGGEWNAQWMTYASTSVSVGRAGRVVPMLLGARGANPGMFRSRSFAVNVSQSEGRLELQFAGGAQGIAYGSNKFAWLLNGLVIAPADGAPTAAAPERAGTRDWWWLGPFDGSDGLGLTTVFEAEADMLRTGGASLRKTYSGRQGTVSWRQYSSDPDAAAPHLPLERLAGNASGNVVYALARVCGGAAAGTLRVSLSGRGKVWALAEDNSTPSSQLLLTDELITGLFADENQAYLRHPNGQRCTRVLVKNVEDFGGVFNTFQMNPYSVSEGVAGVGPHSAGVWMAFDGE